MAILTQKVVAIRDRSPKYTTIYMNLCGYITVFISPKLHFVPSDALKVYTTFEFFKKDTDLLHAWLKKRSQIELKVFALSSFYEQTVWAAKIIGITCLIDSYEESKNVESITAYTKKLVEDNLISIK